MKLKKISLKNIRSYEDQKIAFPEGSTLLSGDIGSGKTSILLGIEFALFGLQPGQRGNSLLRNGKNQGGVKIEIELDEKKIIIERTLKKGKTITQDYCSIDIDGEKKEISVSELKSKVLELLSYPSEFSKKQNILYKFTVYTPQEEMKQIILQDSETRLNTLRHVFGIDKYKKVSENAMIVASKLREKKRLNEGAISNLEQERLEINSKEDELVEKNKKLSLIEEELFSKIRNKKHIQEEKEELSKKIEERTRLTQEIEKTKIMISAKRQSILENNRAIEELELQINELLQLSFDESQIGETEKELSNLKKEKETINSELISIASEINSINMKIEESEILKNKISNLETCPTCLQEVDAVYRANVLNKVHNDIAGFVRKIKELDEKKRFSVGKKSSFDSEISSKEKKISELRMLKIKLENIKEKKFRVEEVGKNNSVIENDAKLLTEHLQSLEKSVADSEKFAIKFDIKQKEFEEAQRQERLSEIKKAELKKEIEVFSEQIIELKEKVKSKEEIRKELYHISLLEDWLSRKFIPAVSFVEKNVMAKLKSEFSVLFEKWFCMLVSDSFNVSLMDDFTPIIEQQDYEIGYAYLSGGERTAVALAYRLALNQVINSLLSKIKTRDLVILDEPTDGFSEQQLDKMRDVLQELNVKQLIIVSHEQKIEGFVENVIRMKKEKGISGIEE